MAMSNLYSKIATKPVKRIQDNMSVSQTNAWMNGRQRRKGVEIGFLGVAKCTSCIHAWGAHSEEKSKPETIGINAFILSLL